MKNKLLITLVVCLFSALTANMAFAAGPGTSSLAGNEEMLATGIKLAGDAVAFAKEGKVEETKKAVYEALDVMSSINSSTWDRKLQKPRGKIRKAYNIAKRMLDGKARTGDSLDSAAELIEKGIAGLEKVQQISQHNL
ncbi:MAG TPA: hypothetical protein ENJ32_01390 [Crenotrichaceae bacterium]|nr:hypothetical protein [Crenotrichaceae bacterium]